MKRLWTYARQGLDSWQIKMIALVFMTIDHLGAYGFEIPVFDLWYGKLRILGRIAMPLFLFVLTESVRYTRNRPKFLLRLYLGAVWTGLFVAVTNFLFSDSIGRYIQSNIFFQYLFTALYIILTEEILSGIRERSNRKIYLGVAGIAATWIPTFLGYFLTELDVMGLGFSWEAAWFFDEIVCSFLASPLGAEYGLVFILMGVIMYFAPNKYWKAAVLAAFSVLCYVASGFPGLTANPAFFAMGYPQHYMILAVPVILLYNGQKGRSGKYFFYLYYPLHRYAISVACWVYRLFCGT